MEGGGRREGHRKAGSGKDVGGGVSKMIGIFF